MTPAVLTKFPLKRVRRDWLMLIDRMIGERLLRSSRMGYVEIEITEELAERSLNFLDEFAKNPTDKARERFDQDPDLHSALEHFVAVAVDRLTNLPSEEIVSVECWHENIPDETAAYSCAASALALEIRMKLGLSDGRPTH